MNQDNENFSQEKTTGHNYDGITEYDNPLPTWWLATFFGTIIFAFIYFIHYEFGGGQTLTEELKVATQELEKLRPHNEAFETDQELLALMKDPSLLALGNSTYTAKCSACHASELQGLVGPNLTDKYWIHGQGKLSDIAQVIRKGVLDKGMPSWESILSKDEVVGLVAYINSKKNSQPTGAKAPQGNLVENY